ncbi:MAG: DUF3788 domain-containing protein [Bacteroidetes bacterium]|nr:DUF3788 domain-containing protein [Bacteroidota bacterium]
MMEKPSLNNPDRFPDENELSPVLGGAFEAWKHFQSLLKTHFPEIKPEWNFYKDGKCWLCKVIYKKKTICWISVWEGFFNVTVYFHLKNETEVLKLELPENLKSDFRNAKISGKIKPFTISVSDSDPLASIVKIMKLKLELI